MYETCSRHTAKALARFGLHGYNTAPLAG